MKDMRAIIVFCVLIRRIEQKLKLLLIYINYSTNFKHMRLYTKHDYAL